MAQNDWSSPSGSRWEPLAPPTAQAVDPAPRRRDRRPVVAVLLTLLGAGAVTTGAAYAQGDGTVAGVPPAPATSHVARSSSGGGGERHTHEPHGSSS